MVYREFFQSVKAFSQTFHSLRKFEASEELDCSP